MRILAAALVLLILTSVVAPILRRVERAGGARVQDAARPEWAALPVSEVLAAAARIEVLNRGQGIRAPEIRAELERLRRLAGDSRG